MPERPGQRDETIRKLRNCFEHVLVSCDGLFKSPRLVVTPTQRLKHTRRNRVELARAQHLLEAFFEAPFHHEMKRIPVMTGYVIGIDLDRASMLAFVDGPVEVMTNSGEAERAVGFRGTGIQFHCFRG